MSANSKVRPLLKADPQRLWYSGVTRVLIDFAAASEQTESREFYRLQKSIQY
jgi:hypothetical protein